MMHATDVKVAKRPTVHGATVATAACDAREQRRAAVKLGAHAGCVGGRGEGTFTYG